MHRQATWLQAVTGANWSVHFACKHESQASLAPCLHVVTMHQARRANQLTVKVARQCGGVA